MKNRFNYKKVDINRNNRKIKKDVEYTTAIPIQ